MNTNAIPTDLRLLVVEDEALVAADLEERLQKLGHTVCGIADTGPDAITQAGRLLPDLILMDIRLRGKTDGIAAATTIREQLNIPVVFVTAHADPATLHRAGLSEPFGYVIKPFEERDLVAAIEIAMHRHRAEDKVRKMEQKLQESQRLESLGILAGGIAHDFNNLLTAVLGNASLCRMEIDPSSELNHFLDGIEKASRRGADLCTQMLAYAGKTRLAIAPVDLNKFVRETVQLIRMSIPKSCRLRLDLATDLSLTLADPVQMQQVIMNLLLNAADAIGDQPGSISIKTTHRELSAEDIHLAQIGSDDAKPGAFVQLEVHDTGTGISPEVIHRIFDPFFTTKLHGRGLGLAATRGIIQGHQGVLFVESEPGAGTTFRIALPVTDEQPEKAAEDLPDNSWRGSGKVLIADDEEHTRQVGSKMLQWFGLQVIEAIDGQEAVEIVEREGQELKFILLDLTMPRLDGFQAYLKIREQFPHLPVIMMSGYTRDSVTDIFKSEGVKVFLQKPFSLQQLQTKIVEALSTDQNAAS